MPSGNILLETLFLDIFKAERKCMVEKLEIAKSQKSES